MIVIVMAWFVLVMPTFSHTIFCTVSSLSNWPLVFLQKDRDKVKLNVNKQMTLWESMERISVYDRVAVKGNANSWHTFRNKQGEKWSHYYWFFKLCQIFVRLSKITRIPPPLPSQTRVLHSHSLSCVHDILTSIKHWWRWVMGLGPLTLYRDEFRISSSDYSAVG